VKAFTPTIWTNCNRSIFSNGPCCGTPATETENQTGSGLFHSIVKEQVLPGQLEGRQTISNSTEVRCVSQSVLVRRLRLLRLVRFLRHALRRIVEELFFGDAFTLPALIRKLFHVSDRAILPHEVEHPPDDHSIAVHKYGPDAL